MFALGNPNNQHSDPEKQSKPSFLRPEQDLDSSEGLGLFAGDKRRTSALQYTWQIVIGVIIGAMGALGLSAVFLSRAQDENRVGSIIFGLFLLMIGALVAHDGIIFFALRRIRKHKGHSQ